LADPSGPNVSIIMISEKPRMAFSGVRNSWLMVARNEDFARLAASASRRAVVRLASWRSIRASIS
jgi:hypothetical protein